MFNVNILAGGINMAATHTTQDISSHDATSIAGSFLQVCEVAGVRVNIGHADDYLRLVSRCIKEGNHVNILNHNMHSVYHYFKNEQLRKIYQKSVVMVDGWWVLAILRTHGYQVNFINRMAWLDFIWPLLSFAERHGFRVFWLGNSPEVNQQGLRRIREQFPSLMISGHHGHFDQSSGSSDNREIVARINDFRTDICIVGMGTPLQELWIDRHERMVCASVMFSAGACLEFISGHAVTPPRWLGPLGLEWAYRFSSNPRRFGFRYLVEPWRVLFEIAKHDIAGVSNKLLGFGGQPSPEHGYYEHRTADQKRK